MVNEKIIDDFMKKNNLPEYLIKKLKENLPKKITDSQLKKVLENLKKEYVSTLISPYESIGVITAQSIGEPATQMTLDTFHFAGVESLNITVGLPRLIEILDAKKKIASPLMWVYLKDSKDLKKVKDFSFKIKEYKVKDISTGAEIDIENKEINIKLDKDIIKKINFDQNKLFNSIKKILKGEIEIGDNLIKIKLSQNISFKDISSYKELVLNLIVGGIKGIEDVSIIKDGDDYVIQTRGSALSQMRIFKEVDMSRTYSNNIFEVEKLFGIEAARNLIIKELRSVVEGQGLPTNERHLMLLADVMTYTGEVKGITRYGIIADKSNVLTRASFETAIRHITSAALKGENNPLSSITENVMTNQMAIFGTGIPKIKVKDKEVKLEEK